MYWYGFSRFWCEWDDPPDGRLVPDWPGCSIPAAMTGYAVTYPASDD
jgi:hypothetical protein